MLERDEYIVFHCDARAKPAQLCIKPGDGPEQQPRLIDQVRAEVVEDSAGVFGRSAFTPHDGWCAGSPAIESGIRARCTSPSSPASMSFCTGQTLAVPATVVIRR